MNPSNSIPLGRDLGHPDLWHGDILKPETQTGALEWAIIFLIAAWLTGRFVRLGIHRYLDKLQRAGADPTGIRFLGQLANVLVYILAFAIYAHLIPELQQLGGKLLSGIGLLSVVVGLAAQSTLGNLISGISLVLYRPFKLGDTIQVSSPSGMETGMVENINLGYTILRTADDRRIVIPNNTMATQTSINLCLTRKGAPSTISVIVASGSNVAAARRILIKLAEAHPNTVKIDASHVTALSGSGATLTLNLWSPDPDKAAALKSDLLESAKKEFDAAGIKISRWRDTK